MFVRFVISNFLSFDEETEFNMLPAATRTTLHPHHIYKIGKRKVVKLAAIYGANGAGKSNLIDAIRTLQQWIKDGRIYTAVNRQKFRLKEENKQLPVSFAIEFYADGSLLLYGLAVDNTTIMKEYLYEMGKGKKPKVVFEHNEPKQILHLNPTEEHPHIKTAYEWMTQHLIIRRPHTDIEDLLLQLCTNEAFFKFGNELLGAFDTGIDFLTLEKTARHQLLASYDPGSKHPGLLMEENRIYIIEGRRYFTTKEAGQMIANRITAFHHNIPFDLIEESHGTQRLLEFLPIFWSMIHHPATILMDEIDQNIHPVLLIALIKKISHAHTCGQLIFTTHESHLLDLDLFRKDEIWFAWKNEKTGATELYSLSEYKNIDNDLDPQKGYFLNRFEAIPFTASLELLKL